MKYHLIFSSLIPFLQQRLTNSEANADKVKKGTVTQNAVEKLMKNRKGSGKKTATAEEKS